MGSPKRALLFIVAAFAVIPLVAMGLHAALYDGLLSLLPESTEYASGYNEGRFRVLSFPASESSITSLLGDPLAKTRAPDGSECWIYSRSPKDTHYRVRIVVLKEAVAVSSIHEFYID